MRRPNNVIYLDYTANMPVEPRVLEAFCEAEGRFIGNANARHGAGREAAGAMARAAEACAELLGVRPEEVIFNSGASEGNNTVHLPLHGELHAVRQRGRRLQAAGGQAALEAPEPGRRQGGEERLQRHPHAAIRHLSRLEVEGRGAYLFRMV